MKEQDYLMEYGSIVPTIYHQRFNVGQTPSDRKNLMPREELVKSLNIQN